MPNEGLHAGVMPAFMDYARLGTSYEIVLDQFRKREPVHAYLLTGPRGVGKMTFARVLACALQCQAQAKPCGQCDACRRILSGNAPELLTVVPQERKQIPIERVREVIEQIGRQTEGYRVVLIEPIEKLTPQAQNCLLKSLEEPVTNVVFLLMAHEPSALLGTIASRCCRVKMTPWPDTLLRDTLLKLGFDAAEIDRELPSCAGNIGHALERLGDQEQGRELRERVRQLLSLQSDADVVGASTRLKEDRDGAEQTLEALEQALERVLLVRTQRLTVDALGDLPPAWKTAAERAPVPDLTELMRAAFNARRFRMAQVNWQSNIDHLLMKILEVQQKWQQ